MRDLVGRRLQPRQAPAVAQLNKSLAIVVSLVYCGLAHVNLGNGKSGEMVKDWILSIWTTVK